MNTSFGDVTVQTNDHYVATVEIRRGPNNFFNVGLIRSLVEAYRAIDADANVRAIVLCAEGKNFCAGADFTSRPIGEDAEPGALYRRARELFRCRTPVVAAVNGSAVGGGLGLACSADFRVGSPESRFTANFAALGFHQGFGLSVTLPAIVGRQQALNLLYTGRRIGGEEARTIGLCDHIASQEAVRTTALQLATQIARSAPLAIASIRGTMFQQLADDVATILDHEDREQSVLMRTNDFAEGVHASAQRRDPIFTGT